MDLLREAGSFILWKSFSLFKIFTWHSDVDEVKLFIYDTYEIKNAFVLCNLTISVTEA